MERREEARADQEDENGGDFLFTYECCSDNKHNISTNVV
jgi:hypothetical protein